MIKKRLEPGVRYTQRKKVTRNDTALYYGSGNLEVFATPALVALMENTALKAVQPCLAKEQETVGYKVDVRHLAPTGIGKDVMCEAFLTEVKGNKLVFEVSVRDDRQVVGEGIHTRYIVDKRKFMSNL